MTDFERQLVNKIDNGEELSNDELRKFCGNAALQFPPHTVKIVDG